MGTNDSVKINDQVNPVHLGKMSGGSVFLFRAQPLWDHTNAFSSWVCLATFGELTDEYGHPVEFGQLIQDIIYSYMRQGARRHEYKVYTNHGFEFSESDFC